MSNTKLIDSLRRDLAKFLESRHQALLAMIEADHQETARKISNYFENVKQRSKPSQSQRPTAPEVKTQTPVTKTPARQTPKRTMAPAANHTPELFEFIQSMEKNDKR